MAAAEGRQEELRTALEHWQDEAYGQHGYDLALQACKDLDIGPRELTGFMRDYEQEHESIMDRQAGVFLSAAYQVSDDDVHFYDIFHTFEGLENLGYELPRDKTLFLDEYTRSAGQNACGLIVNRDTVGYGLPSAVFTATEYPSVLVNLGVVDGSFETDAPGAIAVNFGRVEDDFGRKGHGIHINGPGGHVNGAFGDRHTLSNNNLNFGSVEYPEHGDYMQGKSDAFEETLVELRDGLSRKDRDEVRAFLDDLGALPRVALREDLARGAEQGPLDWELEHL